MPNGSQTRPKAASRLPTSSTALVVEQKTRLPIALVALARMTRPSHVALMVVLFVNGVLLAAWRANYSLDDAWSEATSLWPELGLLILVAIAVHFANEAVDHETD